MKIISFNCNSVRKRFESGQIQQIIATHQPDVLGLQETKVADESFPKEDFVSLGYEHVYVHGQKTHYGVALVSKQPLIDVQYGFPWEEESDQKRLISATLQSDQKQEIRIVNGYFPQGENRDHPIKFPYKKQFYAKLMRVLREQCNSNSPLVILGDMNISPQDIDIGIGETNRLRWLQTGKCSFLPEEREILQTLLDWGVVDCFRYLYPEVSNVFSWFDYRSKGFEDNPKRGLRIDLILATKPMLARLHDCGVDYNIRAMQGPSDHAPVWATFS